MIRKQLARLESAVNQNLDWHAQNKTASRLFGQDIRLWNGSGAPGEEIANRLGWLNLPEESAALIRDLDILANDLTGEGFTTAVLLGMGGSSLAPLVISQTLDGFQVQPGNSLRLRVLDSTSPEDIRATNSQLDLSKTVFIVSSKSGTTGETKALSDYFWNMAANSGLVHPGRHFIAISDPGSKLIDEARARQYRAVFEANPDVGGRFSALSVFGLLPARLTGVNLSKFLAEAQKARQQCGPSAPAGENPGLLLGAALAEANKNGLDKAVILCDPPLASFGIWAEQLVAESSGKNGTGIVPVAQEPVLFPQDYSSDRLFIYLRASGAHDSLLESLVELRHPCLVMDMSSFDELAGQFYVWEVATALACSMLGVNAFDQPNVQETKTLTNAKMEQLRRSGKIEQDTPLYAADALEIRWKQPSDPQVRYDRPEDVIKAFLSRVQPGDYLAILAYLPDSAENNAILQNVRREMANRYKAATTLGFGPRYLHSTGQLHKGGRNNGVFLVISAESPTVVDIPGNSLSFNQFILAQAAGDIEALQSRGRRVLHLHYRDSQKLSGLFALLKS